MRYLEELRARVESSDFTKFMQIWEEYVHGDRIDPKEFIAILNMIKGSEFAKPFGKYVETALPLLKLINDEPSSYEILRLLIDLENTNPPLLADMAFKALEAKHGSDPRFKDRLRLIGLRSKDNFQGAISSYELLAHMNKGKFVYHLGGWGTGEIVDVSIIREQVVVEFEKVSGKKDISFETAFKTLIPIADDHFLARRFGNPDELENEAKENPVEVIRLLLRDLGPKNASEIKDEISEWVIRENEWAKWWQSTRSKLKKDTMIESPSALKDPFKIRTSEMLHEDQMHEQIRDKTDLEDILQTSYNYVRDFPNMLKKEEVKNNIKERIKALLTHPHLKPGFEIQILIFLETLLNEKSETKSIEMFIKEAPHLDQVIDEINILAFKKRALQFTRQYRQDYQELFLKLLFEIDQSNIKEYLLSELNHKETKDKLLKKLQELHKDPSKHPEMTLWYFQQVLDSDTPPFADKEGRGAWLETVLVLLHKIEFKSAHKDLVKKIYNFLSGKRYATVRKVIEGQSVDFLKEFLLLASKCQTFTDNDLKVLRSLSEVVQPSMAPKKKSHRHENGVIWTTEQGYLKTQERVKQIGTFEIVDNAKEIEAARALGDLRENSEYKFALERRARLQGELKMLSDQLSKARILTTQDIISDEVGVGTIVDVKDKNGNEVSYVILGPWDADPDKHILSFQSKFAQAMSGLKAGESFSLKTDEYTVTGIKPYPL